LKLPTNWREMSANAAKVYTWLVANASRRGTVDADFAKIARANGLSYSTLRRAIKELASGNIVATTPANQHQGTIIKVLIGNSAPSTGERTNHPPAALTDERTNCPPEPAEASPPTITAALTGERSDNVPAALTDERGEPSISLETNNRLAEVLAAQIAASGSLAGELTDTQRKALEYIGSQFDHQHLSIGFVAAVMVLYGMHGETLSPGKFAGKIIHTCLEEQKVLRAVGADPSKYSWPPGFQKWRGVLRDRERCAEDEKWGERVVRLT